MHESYIEDPQKRRVAFSKRKRQLLLYAIELANKCGLSIFLAIYDEEKQRMIHFQSESQFTLGEVNQAAKQLNKITDPDARIEAFTCKDYDLIKGKDFRKRAAQRALKKRASLPISDDLGDEDHLRELSSNGSLTKAAVNDDLFPAKVRQRGEPLTSTIRLSFDECEPEENKAEVKVAPSKPSVFPPENLNLFEKLILHDTSGHGKLDLPPPLKQSSSTPPETQVMTFLTVRPSAEVLQQAPGTYISPVVHYPLQNMPTRPMY